MADMTQPWTWTKNDLQSLVENKVQESLNLDYKSSGALTLRDDRQKNDLSKDVSAFANSAGGILVYGIKERGHLPVELDDGVEPDVVTREWLESVLHTRIQPRIDNVRIIQIPLGDSDNSKVAYVIAVPESPSAPHMANDNKYYKRFEYQSVPMEDHEVRATGSKFNAPSLSASYALLNTNADWPTPGQPASSGAKIVVKVNNASQTPAEYWMVELLIDLRLGALSALLGHGFQESEIIDVSIGSDQRKVQRLTRGHSVHGGSMPIWKGISFTVVEFELSLPDDETDYYIGWRTHAPGQPLMEGVQLLRVSPSEGALSLVDVPQNAWRE